MIYEKAIAEVLEFDQEDVITASGIDDCGFSSWDAAYCDGVTQAVVKTYEVVEAAPVEYNVAVDIPAEATEPTQY